MQRSVGQIQLFQCYLRDLGKSIGVRAIAAQVFRTVPDSTGKNTMKTTGISICNFDVATRLIARPQARHRVRRLPIGWILLDKVAWVGLALFFTVGFAVALNLFAGRSPLDPGPCHACVLFFAWSAILLGSSWNA
jgi:hypothetical protein